MADRSDELSATAAQCLALAQSTIDSETRAALLSWLSPSWLALAVSSRVLSTG
jgi:hypothetical protein